MADDALKNAAALRNSLAAKINNAQRQIDRWRAAMARADGFIKQWEEYAKAAVEPPTETFVAWNDPIETEARMDEERKRATGNPKKEEIAAAAVTIIRERGRPMSRLELFKALQDQGFDIQGSHPHMVLSTMLWRMPDVIERVPERGYWPKGDPLPAAETLEDLL